jgi:mannosylglycoprotein endo-beta-mannosidase
VQYADDSLLILPAEEQQLVHLQAILLEFAASTGLKVNFTKSMIVPINVHPDKTAFLAQVLGCQVGKMPFTYLGLPLGTTRPSVQDYLPLVSRIERRLMGITPLLSYAGRLTLVNSVLSAMPKFYLCTLKIHITVIEQIDIYRKHCLWGRGDINRKGGCLVTWSDACKAKKDGGLGIIDLHAHNKALLMKYIHKFYNHEDIPWVSLTWDSFLLLQCSPSEKVSWFFLVEGCHVCGR